METEIRIEVDGKTYVEIDDGCDNCENCAFHDRLWNPEDESCPTFNGVGICDSLGSCVKWKEMKY